MTKKELRTAMRRRNLSMCVDARAVASAGIWEAVERLPEFVRARTVALYCALPDEPATEQVRARWVASKRVVVPRVEGEQMEFYTYQPATLVRGAFGIAEPGAEASHCNPSQIDLVIVPGVAFDPSGGRMGRGRGYYDKYLSRPGFRAVRVGVCYAHQLVEELEMQPHDVPMDRVIWG